MARKRYTEDEVLRALRKKKDCRISGKTIAILSDRVFDKNKMDYVTNPAKVFDLGNGTWGKFDYLTKVHHYAIWHTERFH